jgi:hypothetical protein
VAAAAGLQRRRDLRLEEEWKRGKRELEPSLYKMENGFISNGDGFFFFFQNELFRCDVRKIISPKCRNID